MLSSILASMALAIPGGILVGLFSHTPMSSLTHNWVISVNLCCWYLINYCPFDLVTYVMKNKYIYTFILLLAETRKIRQVARGVNFGVYVYSNNIFSHAVFGILFASSGSIMMPIHDYLNGEIGNYRNSFRKIPR